MSEPHPIMALLLEQNSFVGQSRMPEDEIQPLDSQLAFKPGDAAIVAGSNVPLERDFAIARCIDPSEHAETFPDWEERLMGTGSGWSSHVLCEIFSRADPEISIGWLSRLKLMTISAEQYEVAHRWIEEGFPSEMPEWCNEVYHEYTNQLAQKAPNLVPQLISCPNCQSRDVEIVVIRRIEYRTKVGKIMVEDNEKYVPIHPPEEKSSHTARLHCTKCDSTAELTDDEWILPEISN